MAVHINDENYLPVPEQEGEWCDEDEVPWMGVRTVVGAV